LQDQLLAMLRNQLVTIMSGAVFLFIGLASCSLAAVRRRGGVRIFVWLGIWSGSWGARLLAESPAVVAALPHWVQICVPFLRIAVTYLLLSVASLAWLELSTGKFRHFLRVLVFISLAIGVAGIGVFVITGSGDKLIPYNNLFAAAALLVLVIIVSVPALSRKFLALPNRAVMVVGTLVFAAEALYFSLSRLLHYHTPTTRLTGSLGLAVLLFSFGYVAMQVVLASERRLLSIENELAIAREIQTSILPAGSPRIENLRVAAAYRPMTEVAGDFYEFIPVNHKCIGFLVADVTGHGIPAALIAAMLSTRKIASRSIRPPGIRHFCTAAKTSYTASKATVCCSECFRSLNTLFATWPSSRVTVSCFILTASVSPKMPWVIPLASLGLNKSFVTISRVHPLSC